MAQASWSGTPMPVFIERDDGRPCARCGFGVFKDRGSFENCIKCGARRGFGDGLDCPRCGTEMWGYWPPTEYICHECGCRLREVPS